MSLKRQRTLSGYSTKMDTHESLTESLKKKSKRVSGCGVSSTNKSANTLKKSRKSCENFASFMKSLSFTSDDDITVSRSFRKDSQNSSSEDTLSLSATQHEVQLQKSHIQLENTVQKIDVPSKNLEIVSLQHPSTITLHGYLQIRTIMGEASIFGHILQEGEATTVLSTDYSGLLQLSTTDFVPNITMRELEKELLRIIPKYLHGEDVVKFFKKVDLKTVVVVIERVVPPPNLKFLELYCPNALWSKKDKNGKKKSNDGLYSKATVNDLVILPEYKILADYVLEKLKTSKGSEDTGFQLIVHGGQGCGKSSMLRFLINSALNKYSEVFYLDTDPGQTEFSPPGCVSLTKVTKPLLGPPFSHEEHPLRMVFTGSVSPAISPSLYIKCVKSLIEVFKKDHPNEILFVNTMGWIQGIGEYCFDEIMKHLEPTILVDIFNDVHSTADDSVVMPEDNLQSTEIEWESPLDKKYSLNKTEVYTLNYARPSLSRSRFFRGADYRNFALLSYFGRCQKRQHEPMYLQEFRCIQVCWDDIALYVSNKSVPADRLVQALNYSVVALCHVKTSIILESGMPGIPSSLEGNPLNECIGFAFVRGIDASKQLLYLVTPVSLDKLENVNALIKGDVQFPEVVVLNQKIVNEVILFTDITKGSAARQPVKPRLERKSFLQTPIK